MPVVEFKLTEGAPCIDREEYDDPEKSLFDKLLKENHNKGCHTILNGDVIYDERYRFITSEENFKIITHKPNSWPESWGIASTMNLYQRSYINWHLECYTNHLSPEEIYFNIGAIEKVNTWQSIFNIISLMNILVAF